MGIAERRFLEGRALLKDAEIRRPEIWRTPIRENLPIPEKGILKPNCLAEKKERYTGPPGAGEKSFPAKLPP